MTLWLVIANNHSYDTGEEWMVGVFSTEKRALNAKARFESWYRDHRPRSRYSACSVHIEPTKLDKDYSEEWE